MSDGAGHLRAWKTAMPLGIAFAVAGGFLFGTLVKNILFGIVFGGSAVLGYLLGFYIDPDLDAVGITSQEARLMNTLSIFGVLVVMLFLPYAFIMRFIGIRRKGHRNFFSHTPWVGTTIRLVFLYYPPYRLALSYFPDMTITIWHSLCFFGQVWGLGFADLVHWIMDFVAPEEKNNNGNNRRTNVANRSRKKRKSGSRTAQGGRVLPGKVRAQSRGNRTAPVRRR